MALGGGAGDRGIRRVMFCGVWGSWRAEGRGPLGAAGVRASGLAGWRGGVSVWGWAWGDVPQARSFSPRLLEGLPQAHEDIQVVLGCGELAGLDSPGMELIGKHGFPCGLRHPPSRRPESALLRRLPAGPADQALEGGLCLGPLLQLSQPRAGPALQPGSMGGSVALGGGLSAGVGASGGVMGSGGRGWPGGVLVVLCRGGAEVVGGAPTYADPWVRGHRLCFGVGLGSARAAVAGHPLDVGRHQGLVGGWGHCWLALVLIQSGRGWSVGLWCGLWVVVG